MRGNDRPRRLLKLWEIWRQWFQTSRTEQEYIWNIMRKWAMMMLVLIVSESKTDYSRATGDFTGSLSEARRCMRWCTRASRASDCCGMRRNSLSANSRRWFSARPMSSTSRGLDCNAASIMLGALDPLRWYLRLLFADWIMASSLRHSRWDCIPTANFAVNRTAFRGSELGLREDWGVLALVIVVKVMGTG